MSKVVNWEKLHALVALVQYLPVVRSSILESRIGHQSNSYSSREACLKTSVDDALLADMLHLVKYNKLPVAISYLHPISNQWHLKIHLIPISSLRL